MADERAALPNITVTQLEYLDAVTRHGTWADAAASLGVSPSALSQGLAELERRVGVPLFDRDGRRRVVRPVAAPVVDHARRTVARTRELVAWAERVRSGRLGQLRVGMIDAAAITHFPDALRSFRHDRPEVDLRLTVAPSAALLDRLDDGELDLVVCVRPPGDPAADRAVTHLLDEPLEVYAPGGVRNDDPAGWGPWVTFPHGSHSRALIARALAAVGASFEVVAESHQPEVLAEMVRLGMGWTVLPAARHLVAATDGPVTHRSLVAVRRTDTVAHPAVGALLGALSA